MAKDEGNWHKLPILYYKDFSEDGILDLVTSVIETAIVDLKRTEAKKMRNFFAIRLLSADMETMRLNKEVKSFFLGTQYEFYSRIVSLDITGKNLIRKIQRQVFKEVAKNTKGSMPF